MPTDVLPKTMIRDVNMADRPRERLLRQGAMSLSNQELLAILLRTGTKEESVLALANRVLSTFERLHHLKHATIEEMIAIKGIGEVKAIQILAAIELTGACLKSKMMTSLPFVLRKMPQHTLCQI